MKKILISGANGLIGSHLVNRLSNDKEIELFLLSRNGITVPNGKSIEVDFSKDWDVSVLPPGINIIIHLAQSENFRDFPNSANDIFYVNTLSTLKLADYAQKNKVDHFIYASSAGIYGNGDLSGFDENSDIVYKSDLGFYLATKHCSEVILDNYSNLLNVIMLRFFFVYGQGQKSEMLIPRLVNNVKEGKSIKLSSENGLVINPTYVGDAVDAILACLNLQKSYKINVAGPQILSLREIADVIGEKVGKKPVFEINLSAISAYMVGNIAKMNQLLGPPKIDFKTGLDLYLKNIK
ncbi:MAG: NAD(P)-dependent oxidoreductase [Chitinophagia bacterium]|jgi:nucleoside-diphosphate-sugar epimerase